ncbi:methyltransferase [Thioclava atlantica]|uniref:Methyltransferase n=1 Tax=Thioclava atlantica TaxID=1317124 RepID=A0A085U0Q4_9RHOB|nr:methyltransferase [Thioclava atlantica]
MDYVVFHRADAQPHMFEADVFDLMISRFGVLFFDDPVPAFRKIGGVLRPGGRMVFDLPQRNPST